MNRSSLLMLVLTSLPAYAQSGPAGIFATEGLPTIDWKDADKWMNRDVLVCGKIEATRNIGRICFLNFDNAQDRRFTAVVREENYKNFPQPPETMYADKWVRIHGRITSYQGRAQVVLSSAAQVEILPGPIEIKPVDPQAAKPARPARRATGDTVRIATFNVLNLFDDHDDPYREDEGTPAKPRDEMERLAKTIRTIDADVLALEEVENRDYLERFVRVMLPDMGYEQVVLFEGNDGRGIDCAVLSRLPVGPVTSHRHERFGGPDGKPMSFMRDLLEVRLEPADAPPFTMFVVHLKSKSGGDETEGVRVAEAARIREIVDARLAADPRARFVIGGDFNDTWDSKPLKILRGSASGELVSFFDEIPKDKRITYNKEPHRSMIDFLLCSPAMAKCYQKGTYRIEYGAVETSGSDHNPVVATFKLK